MKSWRFRDFVKRNTRRSCRYSIPWLPAVANGDKINELDSNVRWAVRGWIDDCSGKGITIIIREAYRSYQDQQKAYERYLRGEIAAASPPGESLHQRGLAIDITVVNGTVNQVAQIADKYGITHPLPSRDPYHYELNKVVPPTPWPPTTSETILEKALRWVKGLRRLAVLRALERRRKRQEQKDIREDV